MIGLSRALAAKTYCLCFIAERSVDLLLSNPSLWSDFVAYFVPDRSRWFEDLYRELPHVPALSVPFARASFGDARLALMHIWSLLRPSPSTFKFDADQIAFLRTSLDSFVRLLDSEGAGVEQLVAVRKDLSECQFQIERQWFNLRRWNMLRKVDHFCRNEALGEPIDIETAARNFCGHR